MPIYRLLQNQSLGQMTTAYERTALSLKDRNDPVSELIAKKIIRIAQTGVKDPAEISERAIREFGIP